MSVEYLQSLLDGKDAVPPKQLAVECFETGIELGLKRLPGGILEEMFGQLSVNELSEYDAQRYIEVMMPLICAMKLQRRKRQ
jgi:hypothetical protein